MGFYTQEQDTPFAVGIPGFEGRKLVACMVSPYAGGPPCAHHDHMQYHKGTTLWLARVLVIYTVHSHALLTLFPTLTISFPTLTISVKVSQLYMDL